MVVWADRHMDRYNWIFKKQTLVMISQGLKSILLRSPATHGAAPVSTNSEWLTAKTARERLAIMCVCTGPVGTAIGAVCVESRDEKRTTMRWADCLVDCLVACLVVYGEIKKTPPSEPCVRSSTERLPFLLENTRKKARSSRSCASLLGKADWR